MTNYERIFRTAIAQLRNERRYREFADLERISGRFPYAHWHSPAGLREVVVWCSNDYLGMGQHSAVIAAMTEAVEKYGTGAGGTRNISGTHHPAILLERELASLHEKESALLFTSGYVANRTALATVGRLLPEGVIFSDAGNHNSIIEGIRRSDARKAIFRQKQPLNPACVSRQRIRPGKFVHERDMADEACIAAPFVNQELRRLRHEPQRRLFPERQFERKRRRRRDHNRYAGEIADNAPMHMAADDCRNLRSIFGDERFELIQSALDAVVVHRGEAGHERRVMHRDHQRLAAVFRQHVAQPRETMFADFAVNLSRDDGVESDHAQWKSVFEETEMAAFLLLHI